MHTLIVLSQVTISLHVYFVSSSFVYYALLLDWSKYTYVTSYNKQILCMMIFLIQKSQLLLVMCSRMHYYRKVKKYIKILVIFWPFWNWKNRCKSCKKQFGLNFLAIRNFRFSIYNMRWFGVLYTNLCLTSVV